MGFFYLCNFTIYVNEMPNQREIGNILNFINIEYVKKCFFGSKKSIFFEKSFLRSPILNYQKTKKKDQFYRTF